MKLKIFLTASVALLLAACSGTKELTLLDLERPTVVIDVNAPVTVDREDAIEYYRSVMELDVDNRYRARAMKRLADLELEGGVQKEIDQAAAPTPGQIKEYHVSIDIYKNLLKSYPEFAGNDQVLYQLAQAYERLGMVDESMAGLTQLVKEYPSSPLYDEVQFRRGEILFLDVEYEESAKAFQSVIQFGPSSHFYELALHKNGWNLFKLDRYDEALASFLTLLDVMLEPLVLDPDPFVAPPVAQTDQELVDDTLYAIALVFSYINNIDHIEALINKHGRKNYDHIIYTTLADFYLRQKRFQDAANIYITYSIRYATEPQSAFFKLKLIDVYNLAAMPDASLGAKKHFIQIYGPHTGFWANYSDEVHARLIPKIKTILQQITSHYHALAQNQKQDADYRLAETWYRTYLRAVPNDDDTPKVMFLLADLLYEANRYSDAIKEYEKIAYDYPNNDRGQAAGYAALLAYREQLKEIDSAKQSELSKQQIASILRYTERYPNDPRMASLLTALAQESYSAKEYDKTQLLAQRVISLADKATPDLLQSAWIVNGHVDFDKGAYAKAESSYQQLIKVATRHNTTTPEMVEWLAASVYKQAEEKQAAGDLAGAVVDYQRIAAVAPKSDIRVQAEYDAATLLIDMKAWDRAIVVLKHFRDSYPNHNLQREIPLKLAQAYLESGDRLKAAGQYEHIAAANYATDVRREAAWHAAEIYEKENLNDRSANAYERYLQQFPDPYSRKVEARYRLIQLYSALGLQEKHRDMLDQLVAADDLDNPGHNDRVRFLVAQAALNLADIKLGEFQQVQLVEPLAQNLQLKKARMEAALSAYNKAANYRIAEVVTASTYRIGEIYYQLSTSLMASERPKGLSKEELEEYDVLLEEQAFPFEEKAIAIFESNTKRAPDGLYDQWVKKSYGKLKALMPVRYSKAEKGANIVEELQ